MIRYLNRILLISITAAIALYIVLLNRELITVYFGRGGSLEASVGLFLVASFLLGLIIAASIASLFGLLAYFRERRLIKKEIRLRDNVETVLQARELLATGLISEGISALENALRKSQLPTLIRLELAHAYLDSKQPAEVIRVLEPLRTAQPQNQEAATLTATAYAKLSNMSSALDEINTVISRRPTQFILQEALTLALASGRIDDAFGYVRAIEDRFGGDSDLQRVKANIEIQKLDRDFVFGSKLYEEQLRLLYKKFKDNSTVAIRLATFEENAGNIDAAADILTKTAVKNGDTTLWQAVTNLWRKNNNPERALSALIYAEKELAPDQLNASQFKEFSIETLVELGLLDEAYKDSQKLNNSPSARILQAKVFLARGEVEEAQKVLK